MFFMRVGCASLRFPPTIPRELQTHWFRRLNRLFKLSWCSLLSLLPFWGDNVGIMGVVNAYWGDDCILRILLVKKVVEILKFSQFFSHPAAMLCQIVAQCSLQFFSLSIHWFSAGCAAVSNLWRKALLSMVNTQFSRAVERLRASFLKPSICV